MYENTKKRIQKTAVALRLAEYHCVLFISAMGHQEKQIVMQSWQRAYMGLFADHVMVSNNRGVRK
jgi:hypothetical protein